MSKVQCRFQLPLSDFALDVDVKFPGRGISAIFGHSGSGKTTLLRCVAGLVQAPQGYLEIDGEVWQDSEKGIFLPVHQRALGYVFQEASLFPHLSVKKNLLYGWKRIPAAARRLQLEQVTDLLGIAHLLKRSPSNLSGGERQRVAIARALLTSPRLLLMDEPLSALDAQSKQDILPFLERLHSELEIPVLYVSHSAEEVLRLADNLLLLKAGQVLAQGNTSELCTRLDLQIAQGSQSSALIQAQVEAHDQHYQLTYLRFPGGRLSVAYHDLPIGHQVRVTIRATDVSLTLQKPEQTSILNAFPVKVLEFIPEHPARAIVRLDCQGTVLLARITWKSAEILNLKIGLELYAQVKAVALMR